MLRAIAPLVLLALLALAATAQQVPIKTELVVNGPNRTVLLLAPPEDDRLFLVVQTGVIRVVEDGVLLPTAFLDIRTKVKDTGGEQGLLSMAFHPDYANNGQFYVYYTGFAGPAGHTILERYTVSGTDPNIADPLSTCTIFGAIGQPFNNHNGGHMAFGPDGMLYLSTGDGGSGNDPSCNAQSLSSPLGKMLRIDVATDSCSFSSPPDNPFTGAGAATLIWHLGLRNPWRWSFDRLTGEMYIGDVGQTNREEVSYAPAGAGGLNFGWRVMEGNRCNGLGTCPGGTAGCFDPSFEPAIHDYSHPGNGVCAVIGGYVYRGCGIPGLQGTYFFADECSDEVWSFRWDGTTKRDFRDRTQELTGGTFNAIVSFGEDRYGELYIVEIGGDVWKVVADGEIPGFDCNGNGQIDWCEYGLNRRVPFLLNAESPLICPIVFP